MFSSSSASWSSARSSCQSLGGDLVTIKSSAESSFISSRVSGHYWIGASDSAVEGILIFFICIKVGAREVKRLEVCVKVRHVVYSSHSIQTLSTFFY